MVSAVG